jgi:hypothetical protein
MKRLLFSVTLTIFASLTLAGHGLSQALEPGALKAGQKVEIEYIPDTGRWIPATIIEVVNDGYSYKVSYSPSDDGRISQTNIHFRRVRPASSTTAATPAAASARPASAAPRIARRIAPGSYGCTSSTYSVTTSSYEFQPRGSVEILANGTYRYLGLRTPSVGQYQPSDGKLSFRGGYLAGGEATSMEGQPTRFYLVAPTLPGNRWTCGLR